MTSYGFAFHVSLIPEMHVFKWLIVWLVLYHSVDSKTAHKIQTFKNSKKIPAFGLFLDKKPPTWERGHIVGYSLNSTKGELYFKTKSRKSPIVFSYPSLLNKLYLDKIPKWSELTVGKTVLVEFTPGKYQTGKIISRTNSTSTGRHRNGGKVTVKMSKLTKIIASYRNVRIKGMDVCRHFEVDCDANLEDCQLIYLNKWLPAPAQYKCSCKKGYIKHPTEKCVAFKQTGLHSTQTTAKRKLNPTVNGHHETTEDHHLKPTMKNQLRNETKRKTENKSNVGVILGSLFACLTVIIITGFVLWKNFPKRLSSEERLRQMVIEEMEETWKDENTEVQEKTLFTKISNRLQRYSEKSKDYFISLMQRLREKASVLFNKKDDSPPTVIEKSSSEKLRSQIRKDIIEAVHDAGKIEKIEDDIE